MTRFILGLIGVGLMASSVVAAGNSAITPNSPEDFAAGKALLQHIQQQAATRKPVLPRPYVTVRSQTKYSGRLWQDFYLWHDRPLFASRMLWGTQSGSDCTYASYAKTFELYQAYGMDGFLTFAWEGKGGYERYLKPAYDTAMRMKLDPGKFHMMLSIPGGASYWDLYPGTLDLLMKNPYTYRIDGKAVIGSYVTDGMAPAALKTVLDKLRKESGDKVLFLPQISFQHLSDGEGRPIHSGEISDLYRMKHALPASLLRNMQAHLRKYLDLCDGLYIGYMPSLGDFTFDKAYYNEVEYPLYKSVLAEPQYKNKLLAQQMSVGYTSYHGAQNRSRDGTKTLRGYLNAAVRFQPDILIGTEWDEENEDTSFEPTVAKPMSSQRIIKYYTSRWRGETPTPNAGDDTDVPNLIISQRRQIMLGRKMDVELLNVPDTADGKPYTVKLELLDQDDKVVYSSDPVSFNTARLKDKTIDLPSEEYKQCQALQSRLTIDYNGQKQVYSEGLPFTVLRSTTAWDQTYFCTPLRNVLRPRQVKVKIALDQKEIAPGIHRGTLSADIQSPQKLAAVEVVQDSHVIYAYDPRDEFLRNDPDRRMICLSWNYINQPSRINIRFTADLKGAPSARTFSYPLAGTAPNVEVPNVKATVSDAFTEKTAGWNGKTFFGRADWYNAQRLISIKNEDLAKAVLTLSGEETNGKNKGKKFTWTIPLKDLGQYGVISHVFEDGLMFAVETQYRPIHNTLPVDLTDLKFEHAVLADNPRGVLALRLVSEDGKVWWSKPAAVNDKPSADTVPVYVYSDTTHNAVKLDVSRDRVPDIKYDFTPRWGNILHTDAGRGFYAHAGGYITNAIAFQGIGSMSMMLPFRLYNTDIFKGADKPAPEWTKLDDGQWALKFDGERGNFLAMSNVVIPQRAGFTLTFEVKPDEVKPEQVLFANAYHTKGTFILSVKDGLFEIVFNRRTPGDAALPAWSYKTFKTHIPLVAGKWQKVSLTYDESKLTLSAGGKSESFPFKGIGIYLQGSVFGGYGDRTEAGVIPFYKGLLRSLEIKHYVK
jgi:hypothetical protein